MSIQPSSDSPWQPQLAVPSLQAGEVHVWAVPLDVDEPLVRRLATTLSDDERERGDRFRLDFLRRRFVVGRGALRHLLGQYLHESADSLRFHYGSKGKPGLDGVGPERLTFNLSNSHELALIAVAQNRELGVDVEYLDRPLKDFQGLAERYFAAEEIAVLNSLPDEERKMAFFNGWTRKEAILKAIGTGLTFGLERVVVTLAPRDASRVELYDGDRPAAERWWLAHLSPAPGYLGAIASEGGPPPVAVRRYLAMMAAFK